MGSAFTPADWSEPVVVDEFFRFKAPEELLKLNPGALVNNFDLTIHLQEHTPGFYP